MSSPHEPVSFGLISTADVNRRILEAAGESDHFDVVAVGSRSRERAEEYAREHGIERAYGSYDEVLEDQDLGAVYIGLPNSMHVDWATRALDAGKHVLVEKPLTRRAADAERLFEAAETRGRVVSEGFMWRHHPQTAKLRELLDSGVIGRPRIIRASFSFHLERRRGAEDTRFASDLDGGALMDLGCYCLSAIRFVAGEPERYRGEQVVGASGVDVSFAATLRMPDDVLAHFDCSFVAPTRHELEIVGEDGSILVPEPWTIESPTLELRRDDDQVEHIEVEDADSYRLEVENLVDAMRGEGSLLLGREDAVAQARGIEALYRSAESA